MNNVEKRAELVKNLVGEYYQEGRHDRCKLWVYRHIVKEKMPISERTFWNYLLLNKKSKAREFDIYQLKIDF